MRIHLIVEVPDDCGGDVFCSRGPLVAWDVGRLKDLVVVERGTLTDDADAELEVHEVLVEE